MKYILTLTLILLSLNSYAQKLVTGSEVKPFKDAKNLEWLTEDFAPNGAVLIDFYSSKNPTSVKYLTKYIDGVYSKAMNNGIEIVILSRVEDEDFIALAQKYGDRINFAVDKKGEIFDLFSVLYIPFSVMINKNNELIWQGNISTINRSADELIKNYSKK